MRSAWTSRPRTDRGTWSSRHLASMTGRASWSTVTTRDVGLMIPAFSRAIRSTVLPRCSVCSRSTRVMTDTTPSTTFVASIRPPIPTSTTEVDLLLPEILEGHRGRDFEKRRMVDRPRGRHPLNRRLHAGPEAQHIVIGDRFAVHANPLIEPDKMRRGVQPDSISGGAQDGRGIGAHGALPVRAGDVEDLQAALRVAEKRKEPPDVVQAELDPEPLQSVEMFQRRLIVHRSGRS